MDQPLAPEGLFTKLVWAEKHLERLDEYSVPWTSGASRPYALVKKPDKKPDSYVFELLTLDEPPRELGVIVGDYVHNLRSALDQLIWSLVDRNRGGKTLLRGKWNEVFFPVAASWHEFLDKAVLRHLTFDQVAFVESFQPYHGGDEPEALRDLHELWNTDKHRVINSAVVRLSEQGPRWVYGNVDPTNVEPWFNRAITFEAEAKICGYRMIDSPESHAEVGVGELPVDIGFGPRRRLIEDLPALMRVTKEIIEQAAARFPLS